MKLPLLAIVLTFPAMCFAANPSSETEEPALFARKMAATFAFVGREPGDPVPPEVIEVMGELPGSESPQKLTPPISVRVKASDGHAATYVLGEAVKLSIDETGDIRERHWHVDPPVKDFCYLDPDKRDSLWWVSARTGEYTVTVTSVGRLSGIATDKMKIRLTDRAGNAASPSTESSGPAEDPGEAARRSLSLVKPSIRQADLLHVRDVLKASNTLSEARGYLLRQESLGADRAKEWQSFFESLERIFDAMRDDGKMPTVAEERGALESVAKAIGENL